MKVLLLFFSIFLGIWGNPIYNTTLYDNVLKRWVRTDGKIDGIELNVVDYEGIAKDNEFKEWVESLKTAPIDHLNRNETYAFFINVYNTLAINMMIQHACEKDLFGTCGPIKSIRDIGSLVPYKPVWKKKAGIVGNKWWTLDEVESYLRNPPHMTEDPRLHSAIVCASISCPNLRNEAYRVADIDEQLTSNFNNFLQNTKKGMKINMSKKQVTLSKIFDWFSDDFTNYVKKIGKGNSVIDFILLYLQPNTTDYDFLEEHRNSLSIKHFNYNWNANSKGNLPCDAKDRPCYPLWALLVTLVVLALVTVAILITIACIRRRRRNSGYHKINDMD